MRWQQKDPTPGDPVRVKVSFYYHYGIFVSAESVIQFGLPDGPTRPASEIRVLSSDVYTFLQGGTLEVGKPDFWERRRMRPAARVVQTAQNSLGETGYNLQTNNCEHFMLRCLYE